MKKIILKFIQSYKISQIAIANLNEKKKAGGITLPDFKMHYEVVTIKTAWYRCKNRLVFQWNKMGSQEINPHIYG
jgi:hypothetical protein